jgi:hypothetical protein
MRPARFACCLIAAAALLALPSRLQAQAPARPAPSPSLATNVDAAFQNFWAADSPAAAAQVAGEIAKSGIGFDEAWRRLKQGRIYTAQPTGVIMLRNRTEDGVDHFFAVNIPPGYDPARRYQVRFQLHGGINGRTDNQPRGNGDIGALAGAEQIYVLPFAWNAAPWWGDDQVLNLNTILDALKRHYNVDENRVVLSGVSDGGTGTYFMAMRDTTPFASFLPLNGFIMVLAYGPFDDGRTFANNLRNKPMFVVNGGMDPLYPTKLVEPYLHHLMDAGVNMAYYPQPDAVHNTKWWPEVEPLFEKFVADHPRQPYPDRLTWEAAAGEHTRAHWLVIDEFGAAQGEAQNLPDANEIPANDVPIYNNTAGLMFNRLAGYGRVDLVRTGNTVQATTRGVTAFTLLLSPDQFDFRKPIKVVANGRTVFNARVERSVVTLLKWAAQDNDRTMLYAAEIQIKLAR